MYEIIIFSKSITPLGVKKETRNLSLVSLFVKRKRVMLSRC